MHAYTFNVVQKKVHQSPRNSFSTTNIGVQNLKTQAKFASLA